MSNTKKTTTNKTRVLFVSSEAYPLIKTGGLADVSNSLPLALHAKGLDVRLLLPAYRSVLGQVENLKLLGWLTLDVGGDVRVFEARHAAFPMPLLILDAAPLFDRDGGPYADEQGADWSDNALRYTVFCRAAAMLAMDQLNTGWKPDLVHANDWQSGLVAAFLQLEAGPPKTIFTIHNLAYDLQMDYGTFQSLQLPPEWWSIELGEFYGRFSMMKAGLIFSDAITTVSPTYASEICTTEYGYGYAGILQANHHKLSGILNGIDDEVWNPRSDEYLAVNYTTVKNFPAYKAGNRAALLKAIGSPGVGNDDTPMIGFVGRLAGQKGIDLLIEVIPDIIEQNGAGFVIAGSGDPGYEQQLRELTERYPHNMAAFIGYSEAVAHLLEAGCDLFVMPSLYEPCGLNQMYSLRYGTPPIVRNTGGLADTVVNTTTATLEDATANGFVFEQATAAALSAAIVQALEYWRNAKARSRIIRTGMKQNLGWDRSADAYLDLYQSQMDQVEQE